MLFLEFYFFWISWGFGILNSAIFNSFYNRVEFGTILEGLRNFGEVLNPQTPLQYTTVGYGTPQTDAT